MDYEKKFNDALERARNLYPSVHEHNKKTLEQIFPELAGSEDERIRKQLIETIDSIENFPDKDTAIAWLEKQKEQWSEEDNIGWDEAFACVTRAEKAAKNEEELQNAVTAEKWLKEIKFKYYVHPVKQEWSEEDEEHLKWLCRIIHSRKVHGELSLEEESELGQWIDRWINHNPQPKWDEFDEDCLKRAIWYVENPAPSVIKDSRLALWLNMLRSRLFLKPQPKAEWSEEDDEMLEYIINDVDEARQLYSTREAKDIADKEIVWLKSLRPQPK